MLNTKHIGVVIPAYNEQKYIETVISNIPKFVDNIIVVDDCSTDNTVKIIEKLKLKNKKVKLIVHANNKGVGAAIVTGYRHAIKINCFAVAVMAGDGQMDPSELRTLCMPIIEKKCDYVKGNRFLYGEAWRKIPKIRYFGNTALSLLTKIASGYWWVSDSQTGYTVISSRMLKYMNLEQIYPKYGFPNDILVRLNVAEAKVCDIPVKPIYQGQKSGIRLYKVIPRISFLLLRLFCWRMKEKYIIRNFHPLVFFYFLGFALLVVSTYLFIRIVFIWIALGHIPPINALAWMFSVFTGLQLLMFAMWFDMDFNKHLNKSIII